MQDRGNQPKLTDEQARDIRDRYTGRHGTQMRLAREYGVSQTLIRNLLTGKSYKHILRPGERPDLTGSGRILASRPRDELPNCIWRDAEYSFCDTY
jgi:hypothetical protein